VLEKYNAKKGTTTIYCHNEECDYKAGDAEPEPVAKPRRARKAS
jgi:hypothetical protein